MSKRIYSITLLVAFSFLLICGCTNKAKTDETSAEYVMVTEPDSVRDDAAIQQIIDSIKSKEKITQQDVDFVKEHFIWDGDLAWCINMENKLRYDSLGIMRKKLYKTQKTSELTPLFEEEQKLFEKYKEACKIAFCTCREVYLIGSGTGQSLFISEIEEECCHQLMLADEGALMQLCGGKPVVDGHQIITPQMITRAYAKMMEVQKDCEDDDSEAMQKKCSRTNKQNLLRQEQKAWNQWMAYRATMSAQLPAEARKHFDNGTNNAMRHKLIQLKNQYANIGVVSNDVVRCTLPYDCSDKELMEYSSFDQVWANYAKEKNTTTQEVTGWQLSYKGKQYPAKVPGFILDDLKRNGLLAAGQNEDWIRERVWSYHTSIDLKDFPDNRKFLVIGGLAGVGEYYVSYSGEEAGGVHGYFNYVTSNDTFDISFPIERVDVEIIFSRSIAEKVDPRYDIPMADRKAFAKTVSRQGNWQWGQPLPKWGIWRGVYVMN